ncbi:MAG: radical SAM protein, partial [Methylococcales bacterium]|nr:radical SAM protein [Methylococcales bacterium]
NIWAYARVDTVKEKTLKKLKQAGINWLALGIESANADVRDGASKKMKPRDIVEIVHEIQAAGIRVIGNFIFGLQDDTLESMNETLEMAKELNCEFANFYCAMAYPGSQLHAIALADNLKLPNEWTGFSQHSYNMQPLPSKHLSAKQIVAFRDNAFHEYNQSEVYLTMLEKKFGTKVKQHMMEITQTRLKRAILEP